MFAGRERFVRRAGTNLGAYGPAAVNRLGSINRRRVLIGLTALIVVGGFGLALLSNLGTGSFGPSPSSNILNGSAGVGFSQSTSPGYFGASGGQGQPNTVVLGVQTSETSTFTASTTTTVGSQPAPLQSGVGFNVTEGSLGGAGGLIEFSTNLGITSSSPAMTASAISALAYSVGGYVAYQSTYNASAYVVIRIPSSDYQSVLSQVKDLGAFVSETSNSNDVSVQYTDLNATLTSLKTEQVALLRLLNQTTSINSTLAVESQLQQVNQQINDVESQILQTRTLIDYATINVTVNLTAQKTPLSLALSATPTNGTSPLSVTFNAIVKGGAQPYVVDYNFGDGSATQGQIVIHTFYQAGDYKVLVSVTDQNGTVAQASVVIKVLAAPASAQSGIGGFLGYVASLFLSVVAGIIEVAVVVLPLAAVGAIIMIPIQRRDRNQKSVKQSQ